MPAQNIVRPEASAPASPGRLAAITLTIALVAVVVAVGAFIALRDDDSSNAPAAVAPTADSPYVFPWDLPDVVVPPQLLPEPKDPVATSRRQIVVVSSEDEIASVSSMPGMEVPGIATEYLVVDDAESESMFRELQQALAGPDSRPTTIIDLR